MLCADRLSLLAQAWDAQQELTTCNVSRTSQKDAIALMRESATLICSPASRLASTFSTGLLLIAMTACTGSEVASGEQGGSGPITQEQIEETGPVSSAYSLVQRLRPNWLRKRGRSSINAPGSIIVYIEGSRQGSPKSLRRVEVANVKSIAYLGSDQATLRYGSGHDHGVIEVELKG